MRRLTVLLVVAHGSIGSAVAAVPAAVQETGSAAGYWGRMVAPPRSSDPRSVEDAVPLPGGHMQQVHEEIDRWAKLQAATGTVGDEHGNRMFANVSFQSVANSLAYGQYATTGGTGSSESTGWPTISPSVDHLQRNGKRSAVPKWAVDAFDAALAGISLKPDPARPADEAKHADFLLNYLGGVGGSRFDGRFGFSALALAGPAVKDGTATYHRQQQGGTVVRVPLPPDAVGKIYRMAYRLGLGLELRRQDSTQVIDPFSLIAIRGDTKIPVQVVTPEGLIKAHLTAFSTGAESCGESEWMELSLPGGAMPAIWVVLIFPSVELGLGGQVKRVVAPRLDGDRSYEDKRSELTVTWPNGRWPTLRVVARKFVWSTYADEPSRDGREPRRIVRGIAWGTQVFADEASGERVDSGGGGFLVSGSGTPPCAPP